MEEKNKDEEMIEKLIEKRKQENDAFMKLLNAIENKGSVQEGKEKHPKATLDRNGKKKEGD